jgi:hypothetical protein
VTPGIIGPPGDPQVRRVAGRVCELGAEPVILDLSRFPCRSRASLVDGVAACPGVDVAAVGTWYIRSMPQALPFQPLRHGEKPGCVEAAISAAPARPR